ncbi:PPE domain-containing protein [Mycobacterium shimoidei]|uniref:ESX-1 secretion-associated protein EspB n=1 Tax=Mycobacterium shimoidei TaxID=29313 RepID=A0A1E3TLC1_MYCSH|nr:PPE domain-containing protein [Mycobacterium shimoidei]MCV7258844.1 PPE domain-containing protein [Mycobacterium shimoidei]ODR15263.1 hypothetical protein BHQ16_00475 [Mycobacterium shimoidei]ORW79846.1 hypothetical protein AWC26_13070 [Mycobacterium shimoidei]SRX92903.1 ESX-1 secretion-associated protein EspB [Mycobacterium shimoidei]
MGEELRVDTNDLRAKADEINGIHWATPGEEPPITPASALTTSIDAAANLANAARSIWEYQNWGATEGKRLAESLYHVAKAYDEVDLRAMSEINAGKPISNGPVKPDDCSIPPASHPSAPGVPGRPGHGQGDPEEVENALKDGDQGASLRAAANFWRTTGNNLQTAAEPFQVRIQNWEGVAAEAAYGRFNDFGGWLHSLAGTWQQLAAEGDRVADAHEKARADHTPIYDQWMALKKQYEAAEDGDKPAILEGLFKLQAASEQVRAAYASAAAIDRVQPPEPRDGAGPSIPVSTNGDPRRPAVPAGEEGTEAETSQPGTGVGGGQPGGGGGAASQGGAPSSMAAPVGQSVAPQQTAAGAKPAGAGVPAGGGAPTAGAGAGKGGGIPAGGLPGGMPAAAKAAPNLPKGPNLKPAGTKGGGAGGGGGGGGGGPRPLQPAVAGTAVAPSHGAAEHAAEAAAKAAPGGAMGGAMGGVPMAGHGAHGQGGKEKRRSPGLSPDEELYKEDREWTEGVIGARRRKEAPDAKESK